MRRLLCAAGAFVVVSAAPVLADDLRDLRVGMTQSQLPSGDFAGFRCAAPPGATVAGWAEWRTCPADAHGRHVMRFGFAIGETMVAGHPVNLTAEFAEDGHLAGLRIETDSSARLFLRKKAFLLGLQARSRYGDDDWSCTDGAPDANAEPVGGVFLAETCRKTLPGKSVVVERNLFRRPGMELKDFVGESKIAIAEAP